MRVAHHHHHHHHLLRHKPLAFVAALSLLLFVYLVSHSPAPDQESASRSREELLGGVPALVRHRVSTKTVFMQHQGHAGGNSQEAAAAATGCGGGDGSRISSVDCTSGSSGEAHIVIVGGGLAGLVAALQAGQSVEAAGLALRITLLEKMGNVGGNSAKVWMCMYCAAAKPMAAIACLVPMIHHAACRMHVPKHNVVQSTICGSVPSLCVCTYICVRNEKRMHGPSF